MKWNREKAEAQAAGGRGGAYASLKKGESVVVRPLPVERPASEDDEVEVVVQYGQHYLKATSPVGFFTCLNEPAVADFLPAAWGRNPCALCARWKELKASRDPADQELAKDFNRSIKYLGNVAVGDDVKIHRYNSKSYPLLIALMSGKYEDVFEIRNGRDVEIKCVDDQGGYTLTPEPGERSSLRGDVLDDLHDLYAEVTVLEPKRMSAMLKSGEPPKAEDYVTLRDLMIEKAGKPVARAEAKVDAPSPGRGSAAALAEGPGDDDRPATRRELKLLNGFAAELGMLEKDEELDDEKPYAEIVASIVTEAVGTKTKGLSEDLLAWLQIGGCDVDGAKVAKASPPAAAADHPEEVESDIERQIRKVREASKARKK